MSLYNIASYGYKSPLLTFTLLHTTMFIPVQGYTALLLKFLGPSVFAGIAAMIVIIPFNAIYLKK